MYRACIRKSSIVLQIGSLIAWSEVSCLSCALLRYLACLLVSLITSVRSQSHIGQLLFASRLVLLSSKGKPTHSFVSLLLPLYETFSS